MQIQDRVLEFPKFRRYEDGKRAFYLSTGPVTDLETPAQCNRWDADRVLSHAVKAYGEREGIVTLPKLRDYWVALEQRPRTRKSIFPKGEEHILHLILLAGRRTVTAEYVLKNEDGRTLRPSKRLRLLNPIERHKDGKREIIHATTFDLPFPLGHGHYNGLEDLDPETGFLKQVRPEGKYLAMLYLKSITGDASLRGVTLSDDGTVSCAWMPSYPDYSVRGVSIGNLPKELLE